MLNATTTQRAATATTTRAPAFRADQTSIGLLVLRLILGIVFVGHGTQKLFGWFGGPGLDGTGQFFEFAGFHPGKPLAFLSGLAEFGGGLLLVLGLGASLAGAALIADMLGAVATVSHLGKGQFFAANHGYELEITLAMAVLALTLIGAGGLSLDHGRRWDSPRLRWALAAAGLVAGAVVMLLR